MLAKVGLESWIQRDVVAVVEDKIKLDVLRTRACHVRDDQFVTIGRQVLLIRSGAILPAADRVRGEGWTAGLPVRCAWVAPIGFPWSPLVAETLDVGVAVLRNNGRHLLGMTQRQTQPYRCTIVEDVE